MPIFIRGSGGGSSAKLEGDRYVSPSTSGAVKVTPNSGYDGFKRIFVYGYNTYDVTGTDARHVLNCQVRHFYYSNYI